MLPAGWVSILAAVGIIFLICAVIMASKVFRSPSQGPFGITIPGVAGTSSRLHRQAGTAIPLWSATTAEKLLL